MIKKERSTGLLKWFLVPVVVLVSLGFFAILILLAIGGAGMGGNTAHIRIHGVISSGEGSLLGGSTISAQFIAESVRKADESPGVKAILLDINSPGGSAVASEEVAAAVRNAEKPVVALIRDIGTSGAYWAASSADVVVASPLSITGSVGATASYLEFSELMKKYGLGYERIVSGEHKDSGTPFRELSEEERELFGEIIGLTGEYFLQSVRESRNLSSEQADEISSGRIYIGQQAKELNLIDELGGMGKAESVLKEVAGLEKVSLIEYREKSSFGISDLLAQHAAAIGVAVGNSLAPKTRTISLT